MKKKDYSKEIEELLEGIEDEELLEKAKGSKKESDDSDNDEEEEEEMEEEEDSEEEEESDDKKKDVKEAKSKKESDEEEDEDEVEESEEEEEDEEEDEKEEKKESVEEAINTLMESEANLTEDFKEKASVIFTSALADKVASVRESIEEEAATKLEEAKEDNLNQVYKKVSDYITFALNEWVKDNEVAIESNLQAQVAEEFLSNVHSAFLESYIEVPEDKRNAFAEVEKENQDLSRKLQEAREEVESLNEEKNSMTRSGVIEEASKDMSETDKERLAELLEDVSFVKADTFKKKVNLVVETYFRDDSEEEDLNEDENKSQRKVIIEGEEDLNEDETKKVDPRVAAIAARMNNIKR